ncbi:MAG: ABC transporter permease [Actinobacteria bacterium]|nr:ABC transporter permease [Actinomycetota bacterium]
MNKIELSEKRYDRLKSFFNIKGIGTLIVFIVIFVFFAFASNSFLTVQNLINILRQVSILVIVAVGMTFLIISGGIDLSIGSTIGLCGVITAIFVDRFGFPLILSILIAIILGGLIGLLNGTIVTKINIPPLLATLGMMIAIRGVALVISEGKAIFNLPKSFLWLGRGYVSIIPVPVIIMLIIFFIFFFIQQKTAFSIYAYAIGGNRIAARLSGIKDEYLTIIFYVITGLLTGFAAVMTASRLGVGLPTAGEGFEFDVIIAVVVGGTSIFGGIGTIQGTLLGALIVGVLTNGMIMLNIHSFYQSIAKGLLLIIAVGAETIRHKKEI